MIVRFHDIARLDELGRAVFSLVGQQYRPLRILLAMQRFTATEQEAVLAALAPILSLSDGVELVPLNYEYAQPKDARSELSNLGFAAASGRYVAMLDYDDILYPEAYRLLIGQLRADHAVIAFARTAVVTADVHGAFLYARRKANPFPGRDLGDLFAANFCPIHSYVIDQARLPSGSLRYESLLTIEEDYDQLIRICAAGPADFSLIDTDVGLYFHKSDDSNTFTRGQEIAPEILARIDVAREFIELRRRMTVLAPEVQRSLGMVAPLPGLTVRNWLDMRGTDDNREQQAA